MSSPFIFQEKEIVARTEEGHDNDDECDDDVVKFGDRSVHVDTLKSVLQRMSSKNVSQHFPLYCSAPYVLRPFFDVFLELRLLFEGFFFFVCSSFTFALSHRVGWNCCQEVEKASEP